MHALLLELSDHAFDYAILLRAVRGDEFLAQPATSDQRRVMATGEHQSIIGAQQERLWHYELYAGDSQCDSGRAHSDSFSKCSAFFQ